MSRIEKRGERLGWCGPAGSRRSICVWITAAIICLISSLPAAEKPDILLILADDVGFSDIGCYGSEIQTPNLDKLAANGLRFTQFYNTARCCPTRAALMTGLYSHQAGMGHMTENHNDQDGYRGTLNKTCVTIAEVLKPAGYRTYMTGKWHVTAQTNPNGSKESWPIGRGFERYYGTIMGAGNYFDPALLTRDATPITPLVDPDYKPARYYYTDAITDNSIRFIDDHKRDDADKPFFLYVAYTAAHWPLHALDEDIAKYKGKYDAGYDAIRRARFERMKQLGVIDPKWNWNETVGNWNAVANKEWEARCMEVYAAQIDRMDQGIGRIVAALEKNGQLQNTLIFFMQDNGACAEIISRSGKEERPGKPTFEPMKPGEFFLNTHPKQTRDGRPVLGGTAVLPGPDDTFMSYGRDWANVSDTPFREYKHWVHEGGISTPLIVHWPAGIKAHGELRAQPGHLIDIMATCVDVAGAAYPAEFNGNKITPLEGKSLRPAFDNKPIERDAIFWEHEGNRAVRDGKWKLVAKGPGGKWELYDMEADRTETQDLASSQPGKVEELTAKWEAWARRAHVIPWIWKPQYGAKDDGTAQPAKKNVRGKFSSETKFELKQGDDLNGETAPAIGGKPFRIGAEIETMAKDGVIIAQGGTAEGITLYMKDSKLHFTLRRGGKISDIAAIHAIAMKAAKIDAQLAADGSMTLSIDGQKIAEGKAPGLLNRTPTDGLQVGSDKNAAVGDYETPFTFEGKITKVILELK
ncbi:MAG TPA: arylsulfatase [Planctomycetota bacterium]|nr:arylsulfatase [Planctomycetota bacterium]